MRTASLAVLAISAVVATSSLAGCSEDPDAESNEVAAADLAIEVAFENGTAVVGQNAMIVTLTDSTGAAVVGADVVVDPQMPSMGHGSREVPVVTDNGDGTYRAFPVTFQMAGPWEVTVTASAGDETAEVVRQYDVQ